MTAHLTGNGRHTRAPRTRNELVLVFMWGQLNYIKKMKHHSTIEGACFLYTHTHTRMSSAHACVGNVYAGQTVVTPSYFARSMSQHVKASGHWPSRLRVRALFSAHCSFTLVC